MSYTAEIYHSDAASRIGCDCSNLLLSEENMLGLRYGMNIKDLFKLK